MTKIRREKPPAAVPKGERAAKSREDVLSDFRKIAAPLRGQNRDRKPKP